MNKKIIIALLFLGSTLFAQTGASFKFGDVSTWWIPKFRPFGTNTTLTDSTNYVTLNKGLYVFDSIKTDRDLIVRGAIVLDTLRLGKLYYEANELRIINSKTGNADILFIAGFGSSSFKWEKNKSLGVNTQLMQIDTISGLTVQTGNIQLTGGTQQIKIPKDTVSDYTSADAVTLNRQQGVVTTKSLTTASGSDYTITVNNSLVSSSTNVWAMIKTNPGTGAPIIRQCATGSGTITIIIRNLGSGSLNSAISFQFIVFN